MYGFAALLFYHCCDELHAFHCWRLPSNNSKSPKYTHDFIPCNGANINEFQRYHFVPRGVIVNLLVNIKKVVALEVLSTFLEILESKNLNLYTEEQLNTVLPTTSDARYRVA